MCDECRQTRWIRAVLLFPTPKDWWAGHLLGQVVPHSENTLWFVLSALDPSDMFVLHDWLTRRSEITAWLRVDPFMSICTLWHSAEWASPLLCSSLIHSALISSCIVHFHFFITHFWLLFSESFGCFSMERQSLILSGISSFFALLQIIVWN